MTPLSVWFVVFTNFSVLPTVVYFIHHKKYIFAWHIGTNAAFSFCHHAATTEWITVSDDALANVFTALDAIYSYLSIVLFSLHFFLLSPPQQWMLQMNICQVGILVAVLHGAVDMTILIAMMILWILMVVGSHITLLRPFCIYNPYLWLTCTMVIGDLSCFFLAVSSEEFNWFHSGHHLLAFTLPFVADCAVEWGESVDWEGV